MDVRVVHLLPSLRTCDTSRLVLDLALVARAAGQDDRIVLYAVDRIDSATDLQPLDVPIAFLPSPGRQLSIRHGFRMRGWLQSRMPRVLHSHDADGAILASRALFGLRPRPRFVTSFHDAPAARGLLGRLRLRRALRRANVVVATSLQVGNNLPAQAAKLRVIMAGVDTHRFTANGAIDDWRPALGIGRPSMVIANVAPLSPENGQLELIDAISQLQARQPVHLLLIDQGEPAAEIRAAIQRNSGVHLLPAPVDMPRLLREIDVFVQPGGELIPLSLIEAMATSIPAIVADSDDSQELLNVEGTRCGMLVPPRDTSALVAALRELLDQRLRTMIGQRARMRVLVDRTLRHMQAAFDEVYASI